MKHFLLSLIIALAIVSCGDKQLNNTEKFNRIQVGMPLHEALSVFGLKDTVGKSFTNSWKMVEMVDTTQGCIETIPTGQSITTYFVQLDSIYQIQVDHDTVFQKSDLTELNAILKAHETDSLSSH